MYEINNRNNRTLVVARIAMNGRKSDSMLLLKIYDPELHQGPGGMVLSPILLGPVLVWNQQGVGVVRSRTFLCGVGFLTIHRSRSRIFLSDSGSSTRLFFYITLQVGNSCWNDTVSFETFIETENSCCAPRFPLFAQTSFTLCQRVGVGNFTSDSATLVTSRTIRGCLLTMGGVSSPPRAAPPTLPRGKAEVESVRFSLEVIYVFHNCFEPGPSCLTLIPMRPFKIVFKM